jgi:parallel beta helix pectate lyase-like protein
MLKLLSLFAFLVLPLSLLATPALAQTTSVTLQVTDTDGQTWNNGTWSVLLELPPGSGFANSSTFKLISNGQIVPNQAQAGALNGTGGASFTVTPNSAIGAASVWNFNVCAQGANGCLSQQITVNGASQSVTINPPAIRISMINPPLLVTAYADSELINLTPGQQYFNLTTLTQRQWNGTMWVNLGGGGGGGGTTINPTNGVIPVRSNSTTFVDSPVSVSGSQVQSTDTLDVLNNGTQSDFNSFRALLKGPLNAVSATFIGQYSCDESNGTLASPTATAAGDQLCGFGGAGYANGAFVTSPNAGLFFFAGQNWTSSNQGTFVTIGSTPNNTIATIGGGKQGITIDNAGNVEFGNPALTSVGAPTGSAYTQVNGSTGAITTGPALSTLGGQIGPPQNNNRAPGQLQVADSTSGDASAIGAYLRSTTDVGAGGSAAVFGISSPAITQTGVVSGIEGQAIPTNTSGSTTVISGVTGTADSPAGSVNLTQYGLWAARNQGGGTVTNTIGLGVDEEAGIGGSTNSIQLWIKPGITHTFSGTSGSWGIYQDSGGASEPDYIGPAITFGGNVVVSSLTSGNCVQAGTAGLLQTTGSPCGSGGGGVSSVFGSTGVITALTIPTGDSLTVSGSGTNNATSLLAGTWAIPGAIGSTTPNTGVFSTLTDSALTSGNCVQASTAGLLTTTASPCGSGSGGVTGSGTIGTFPIWVTSTTNLGNSVLTNVTGPPAGINYSIGGGESWQLDASHLSFNTGLSGSSNVIIANTYAPASSTNAGGIVLEGAPATGSACGGYAFLQGNGTNGLNNGALFTAQGGCSNGFGAIGGSAIIAGGSTSASNPGGNVWFEPGTGGFGNGYVGVEGNFPFYVGYGALASLVATLVNGVYPVQFCTNCQSARDGALQGSVAVTGGTNGSLVSYDGANFRVLSGLSGSGGNTSPLFGAIYETTLANLGTDINGLTSGGTIVIPPSATGMIPSGITVSNPNITIICQTPFAPLARAASQTFSMFTIASAATGFTIQGCTINMNGGSGLAILANAGTSNLQILNNNIIGSNGSSAIQMNGTSGGLIQGNTITNGNIFGQNNTVNIRVVNNDVTNTSSSTIVFHGTTSGDAVQRITIAGNHLHVTGTFGVEVGAFGGNAATDIIVNHNECDLVGAATGCYSMGTVTNPVVTDNTAAPGSQTPTIGMIEIEGCTGGTVTGNEVVGGDITINESSGVTVSANQITIGTGLEAIYLGGAAGGNTNNNIVSNNEVLCTAACATAITAHPVIWMQANNAAEELENNKITNNTIVGSGSGNSETGVYLEDDNGTVTGNQIAQNIFNSLSIGYWANNAGTSTTVLVYANTCPAGTTTCQHSAGTNVTYTAPEVRDIHFAYGTPGGSALSTGILGYQTIPLGCSITGWNIEVDAGTATVKTLKVASGTAIPTLGSNSISTSGVSIASGTVVQSTTLTDFTTTAIAPKDIVAADLITTSGVGYINFELIAACSL